MKALSVNKSLLLTLIAGILLALLGTLWTTRPVASQGPDPEGTTVLLVIDDSRSMNQTDPNRHRSLGGRLLIERLFPEDRIGMVFFSSRAKVVRGVSTIGGHDNREHLKSSFELLQSSGATDILDALEQAFSQLEEDTTDNPKLVIFLTDGQLLYSEEESPEYHAASYQAAMDDLLRAYRANQWPVFPVSFGHDVDTQFLQNVAEVTGGEACDALTDSELVACFQTALDSFKETEKVLDLQQGCLETRKTVEYPVNVDPYARQLSVVLEREDSSLAVAVFDPTGAAVETYREEGDFLFYNLTSPSAGAWIIRLEGPGCFGQSFSYIHSDITIDLKSPGPVHAAHQPMDVRATVLGRRPTGDGSWEPLTGDLALSIASPAGTSSVVPMVVSRTEHSGRYGDTGVEGDYRMSFQVTVGFPDPHTGRNMERTYLRQKRVEVVAAPVVELAVDGEGVYRVLPGDSFEVRGRVTPPEVSRSPGLKATFSGGQAALDFAPDGTFSGILTPDKSGKQGLVVSFETTLAGRYGEVRYPGRAVVELDVEFRPLVLQLTQEDSGKKLVPGRPVSLKAQFLSGEVPVKADQPALAVKLLTPRQDTVNVEMAAVAGGAEFQGAFIPKESGPYTLSSIDTPLTRNGVPFTAETGQALEILLRPGVEVDVNTLSLGQVYPGAIVTRQIRVSNHLDQRISLVASTDSKDFSVELSPALVSASSEMQPIQAQFQLSPQAGAGGGGVPAGLFLDVIPRPIAGHELVIPITYEVGDFFIATEDHGYDLGFVRQDSRDVPLQLNFDFHTPVPVKLTAEARDGSEKSVFELSLPEGQGKQTTTLALLVPDGLGPGSYQGTLRLTADPPIPVRAPGEINFTYQIPSPLQVWVMDNRWWTLMAGGGAALAALVTWGGIISRRVVLQGRLFIYDRLGLTRARREDLRRFSRPEVTIGRRADISLSDPSGVIEEEHALIAATRETPYPRVHPVALSRITGPFGVQVGVEGAPLSQGDTFSIGHYNLEWSPAWSRTGIGQVLANPWWKLGVVLAVCALGIAAVAFYVILL